VKQDRNVYFVSGIDTGVGKTVATGLMARWLAATGHDVTTVKLVQTGNIGFSEDIAEHRRICGGLQLPEDGEGLCLPEAARKRAHEGRRNASHKHDPGSDLRNVLYWNPCVAVNNDGTSTFDFYASDAHNTTYIVTVEGVANDGTPFRTTHQVTKR
jgi:hypothetical protein